jgi:hypothetical protein
MSKQHGIWNILLPLSVVFLGVVYYIKVPSVRRAIDARTDIASDLLGRFVDKPEPVVMRRETPPRTPMPLDNSSMPRNRPLDPPPISATPRPVATPEPVPAVFDPQKLAAEPARWPKKVALLKPATFTAMLNGKPIGSLVVPAGSEVRLKSIQDGKLGLEFNGGLASVAVDDTDLVARVKVP